MHFKEIIFSFCVDNVCLPNFHSLLSFLFSRVHSVNCVPLAIDGNSQTADPSQTVCPVHVTAMRLGPSHVTQSREFATVPTIQWGTIVNSARMAMLVWPPWVHLVSCVDTSYESHLLNKNVSPSSSVCKLYSAQ